MFAEAELALKDIDKIDVQTLLLYGTDDKVVNISEYENSKSKYKYYLF